MGRRYLLTVVIIDSMSGNIQQLPLQKNSVTAVDRQQKQTLCQTNSHRELKLYLKKMCVSSQCYLKLVLATASTFTLTSLLLLLQAISNLKLSIVVCSHIGLLNLPET